MTELTLADSEQGIVTWGEISLENVQANALAVYLGAPRNERRKAQWHTMCMAGQAAAVFFKGPRASDTFRLTASKIAADAYEELRDQKEVAIIKCSSFDLI